MPEKDNNTVMFQSKRLAFRPPRREDIPFLCGLYTHPNLMSQIAEDGEPLNPDQAQKKAEHMLEVWRQHGYGMFVMNLRNDSGRLIGYCGFKIIDRPGVAELGYILDKPHWGQGLAYEAAARCVEYARDDLGLIGLIAMTHPQAAASQRILAKLGFEPKTAVEGVEPKPETVYFERALND